MRHTLFFKMLITYLSLTLALLIVLGVTASTVFVSHQITERKNEMSRECSEITAVVSGKYMDDEKRNVALEELITISRKYDALIQMRFTDPYYGSVSVANITDDEKKWQPISEYFSYMDSITPTADRSVTETDVFSDFTDMHTMTLAVALRKSEAKVGILCFTVDITRTYNAISSVIIDMVIIAAFAIVLAFLAVLYITERMTRPVTEMTRAVRRFSKGEYDARISHISDDEIGELARSFNKMADAVNNLEQTRKSFVANVSHELRSPLTSMKGFLVAMQDGTIPPESFNDYLTLVIGEIERLTAMVNDLLDMARIESGREKELVFEVFDMAEIARTTAITFEARVNAKRINMQLSFCADKVFVYADRDQIIHVLRNLIDNAVKFTPDGGTITIRITESRHKAFVSVQDTGSGIAEDNLPYIFDRFWKEDAAHTRKSGSGTGLGLAIVKRIIDAHEQDITVENKGGACFTFTLKRAQRPKRIINN